MKESFSFKRDPEKSEFELVLENGREVLRRMRAEEERAIASEAQFEVAEETEYGPHLVRVKETKEAEVIEEPAEVIDLKKPTAPASTKPLLDAEMTRRSFVGALGLGAVAVGLSKFDSTPEENQTEASDNSRVETITAPEVQPEAPQFFDEISGFEARANLRFDEVLFVDESNRPLGDPVKLEAFTVTRDGVPYSLSPGPTDEVGVLTDGIAGEWLSAMRSRLRREYPQAKEIKVLSVIGNFRAALNDTDEPKLVAGIASGQIATYRDVIDYFGNKPVVGAEDFTRKEYVQQKIKFHYNPKNEMGAPPVAQAELRKIVPGLCMQESGFNNDLTSRTGARGIFQFQPVTWEEQGGTPQEINSLRRQVELAGNYLSGLYWQVQHFAGDKAMEILKKNHDAESLARDVLVPLTINSYNAGASRVGAAVREYYEHAENRNKGLSGKDLFIDIANFARESQEGKLRAYGNDAREYVTRIYGNARALTQNA
jgi:hypothetical protein